MDQEGEVEAHSEALTRVGMVDKVDTTRVNQEDPNMGDKEVQGDPNMVDQEDPSMVDQEDPSMVDREDPSIVDQEDPSMVDQEDPSMVDQEDPSMADREDLVDPNMAGQEVKWDLRGVTTRVATLVSTKEVVSGETLAIKETEGMTAVMKGIIAQ